MAELTNTNSRATNTNANFGASDIGVPGAQQQQQPFYQQEPVIRNQRQFEQQYQQSFYSQPSEGAQVNSVMVDADMAAPAVVPANTNAVGDGSPGFSVGGVGVPGAQVELIDSMKPQTRYQHSSSPFSRVGIFNSKPLP
ncbi:hypothetical protein BGW39_007380 [Mortierella sp. 14UC]|nr:hypothetical protein BGW39_007380 [Mortierella sp. 14UC]